MGRASDESSASVTLSGTCSSSRSRAARQDDTSFSMEAVPAIAKCDLGRASV